MVLADLDRMKVGSTFSDVIGVLSTQDLSLRLQKLFNTARDEWRRYAKEGGAQKQQEKQIRSKILARKKLVSEITRIAAACCGAGDLFTSLRFSCL